MKRLGRVLGSLLAVALTVFSMQAFAATQMGGRDFNHMTTGFILSGGHAVAACETCHIGGVFKGTPRACDGCHAVGKRIIATPKTNSHIVTDAPCESCHFNTATWLGARFNHGNAQTGQCATCHNGRLSFAKPSTHNTGKKATESCDSCHRSSAWLPASWNHTLSPGICSTCHMNPAIVSSPNLKPVGHGATALKGQLPCDSCHNYIGWYPNRFKHNTGGLCSSCHDGIKAKGARADHIGFTGWPMECNECHLSTVSFAGALGNKPSNHILYNNGVSCSSCHSGGGILTVALHNYVASPCTTCHLNTTTYLTSRATKKKIGHEGMKSGDDCIKCHTRQYTSWNKP